MKNKKSKKDTAKKLAKARHELDGLTEEAVELKKEADDLENNIENTEKEEEKKEKYFSF